MSEVSKPRAFLAAIAWSVSAAVWAAAMNVLNQKYGTSIPDWTILVAAYVAAGFWLYWVWHTEFVGRRRMALLYTKRLMLVIFIIIGAIVGAFAGAGLWLVNRNEQRMKVAADAKTESSQNNQSQQVNAAHIPTPPSADDLRLARIEFRTDSAKPLRGLRIDVALTGMFSPAQLGHFRVLIDFVDFDDVAFPNSNVWIGLRDAYGVYRSEGKEELVFGITGFVRGADAKIKDTTSEMRGLTTDHLQMDFRLTDTPYRTIDDLNHKVFRIFVTESLIDKIKTLSILGNNYILVETDAKQSQQPSTPLKGAYDTWPWPSPLTPAEQAQPWRIVATGKPNAPFPMEGATMFDFDRNIPRKSFN